MKVQLLHCLEDLFGKPAVIHIVQCFEGFRGWEPVDRFHDAGGVKFPQVLPDLFQLLTFLVTFGVQLFMYATPVIYSLTSAPEKLARVISLNPLSPIIEGMRLSLLGHGAFSWSSFFYAASVILFLTAVGIVIFNKTEKDFIDTV